MIVSKSCCSGRRISGYGATTQSFIAGVDAIFAAYKAALEKAGLPSKAASAWAVIQTASLFPGTIPRVIPFGGAAEQAAKEFTRDARSASDDSKDFWDGIAQQSFNVGYVVYGPAFPEPRLPSVAEAMTRLVVELPPDLRNLFYLMGYLARPAANQEMDDQQQDRPETGSSRSKALGLAVLGIGALIWASRK